VARTLQHTAKVPGDAFKLMSRLRRLTGAATSDRADAQPDCTAWLFTGKEKAESAT